MLYFLFSTALHDFVVFEKTSPRISQQFVLRLRWDANDEIQILNSNEEIIKGLTKTK